MAEPRDLRYRRQLFPESEELVFDTDDGGFVPLPIIVRKLMRHLNAAEFRLLAYLQLRASRYGICFPTLEEMAHEIGLTGRKNLIPHLQRLESIQAIRSKSSGGRKFYVVHDPRVPLQHLVNKGEIDKEEFEEINGLLEDLGREKLRWPSEAKKKRAGM